MNFGSFSLAARVYENLVLLLLILLTPWVVLSAHGQQCNLVTGVGSFNSGSDGSDGTYDLTSVAAGTTVIFQAKNFNGNGVASNVYNFNKIIIPANVTVKFTENYFHGPVYWLAQSDVTIAGTLDLSGDNGVATATDASTRTPAAAGSGGYSGGLGVGGSLGAMIGNGPGGGNIANNSGGGQFLGTNTYLIPLVGGSGGMGGGFGGGGGGGGAILVASSTSIHVNGAITAAGGGIQSIRGGSGGAIRLVANSISGSGSLNVSGGSPGGYYGNGNGGAGAYRVEACSTGGNFTANSTPIAILGPSTPPPSIQVTSIAGTQITENPFTFPDLSINTSSAIPVVITAHQVPVGTAPTLYVWSASGDQQLTCPAGGLQGTLATSTCTINLTFNFGGSRGYVKATWTP